MECHERKHRLLDSYFTNFIICALHYSCWLHPGTNRGVAYQRHASEFHRVWVLFQLRILVAGILLAQRSHWCEKVSINLCLGNRARLSCFFVLCWRLRFHSHLLQSDRSLPRWPVYPVDCTLSREYAGTKPGHRRRMAHRFNFNRLRYIHRPDRLISRSIWLAFCIPNNRIATNCWNSHPADGNQDHPQRRSSPGAGKQPLGGTPKEWQCQAIARWLHFS